MNDLETEAKMKAEHRLVEMFQPEFDRIHAELCVKMGLELVTIRRTIYKQVSELEAMLLIRHGWERIDGESL